MDAAIVSLSLVVALSLVAMLWTVRGALLVQKTAGEDQSKAYARALGGVLSSMEKTRDTLKEMVERQQKLMQEQVTAVQMAYMDSAERTKTVMVEALDRVQARSLAETVQAGAIRDHNATTLEALKDELRRQAVKGKDEPARIFHDVNGKEYREDELETW